MSPTPTVCDFIYTCVVSRVIGFLNALPWFRGSSAVYFGSDLKKKKKFVSNGLKITSLALIVKNQQ